MSAGLTHPAPVRTGLGIPLFASGKEGTGMFRTLKVSNPSLCGNFVCHFLKAISSLSDFTDFGLSDFFPTFAPPKAGADCLLAI